MVRSSVNNYSLILLGLVAGIVLAPLHIMQFDLSMIPGDLLDSRFNIYMLEHGFRWITGHVQHFWNAQMCYPVPNVTAFSENYIGTFWIYSLFRLANFDRETSFQFWAIVLFTLNYLSAAYVMRKMGIHIIGVVCGSFIFAFSMPVIAQMPRIQLLPRFMVPLVFLYTMQYLDRPGLRVLLKLCLGIVVQFYCTFYIGYFAILGTISIVIGYIILNFRIRNELPFFTDFTRDIWRKIGVAFGSALLLLPVMVPYVPVAAQFGYRKWPEISLMMPRISSYLLPPDGTLLWNWLKPVGQGLPMVWEHYLFPGALPIVAVIALIFIYVSSPDRDALLKKGFVTVIALVILFVMTLSVQDLSPYRLIYRLIPGLSSMRAVTRIILLDMFLLSIIAGVVITRCWAMLSGKPPVMRAAFAVILTAAVGADQFVAHPDSFSKQEAQERSRRVEMLMMKKNPGGTVYAYMPSIRDVSTRTVVVNNIDAMMAAQNLDKFTVNGYTGNYPPEYMNLRNAMAFPSEERCLALRRWGKATERLYNRPNWYKDITVIDPDVANLCPASKMADHNISGIDHALEDAACYAEITFAKPIHVIDQSNVYVLNVMVKNMSAIAWPVLGDGRGRYAVGLTYRWLQSNRKPMTGYDQKVFFLHDLKPHETVSMSVLVPRPFNTGEYYLEFDVFQDSAARFQDKGSKTSTVKIIAKGLGDSGFIWK